MSSLKQAGKVETRTLDYDLHQAYKLDLSSLMQVCLFTWVYASNAVIILYFHAFVNPMATFIFQINVFCILIIVKKKKNSDFYMKTLSLLKSFLKISLFRKITSTKIERLWKAPGKKNIMYPMENKTKMF